MTKEKGPIGSDCKRDMTTDVNMTHYTYKIINTINDKLYIGVTNDISKRWKDHIRRYNSKTHSCLALYSAMKKHGVENFSIHMLKEYETMQEAYDDEIRLISEFDSISPNGYNIDKGGKGGNRIKEGQRVSYNTETGIIEIISKEEFDSDDKYVGVSSLNTKITINGENYIIRKNSTEYSVFEHLMNILPAPKKARTDSANYVYPDGTYKNLPRNHPDVLSGVVSGSTVGKRTVRYFEDGRIANIDMDHQDYKDNKCVVYVGPDTKYFSNGDVTCSTGQITKEFGITKDRLMGMIKRGDGKWERVYPFAKFDN